MPSGSRRVGDNPDTQISGAVALSGDLGESGGKALDGGAELLKRIKAAQDQGGAVYSPLALWPGAVRVLLLAIEALPCFSDSMNKEHRASPALLHNPARS